MKNNNLIAKLALSLGAIMNILTPCGYAQEKSNDSGKPVLVIQTEVYDRNNDGFYDLIQSKRNGKLDFKVDDSNYDGIQRNEVVLYSDDYPNGRNLEDIKDPSELARFLFQDLGKIKIDWKSFGLDFSDDYSEIPDFFKIPKGSSS